MRTSRRARRRAGLALAAACCADGLAFQKYGLARRRTLCVRNMDLDVQLFTDGVAATVGGTMGVAGTLAVYENNRFHAKQRSACAYCEGAGLLVCGACLGGGTCGGGSCPTCRGTGTHVCVNCEATGLAIPPAFERKEIYKQDDELERQLDEIGIAALADDIIKAENSPGDLVEVTRMLQRRALAEEADRKKA